MIFDEVLLDDLDEELDSPPAGLTEGTNPVIIYEWKP